MNDKFLKIITYLTIGIISYISASYFYKMIEKNHIEVPGTVIGKEKSYRRMTYKPYVAYTKNFLTIKPNNRKYKNYTVCVDYEFYSSHNVGSHVCFKVLSYEVDPNGHDDTIAIILFVFSIGGCIFSFSSLFSNIFCDECN